ncbi:CheY-like chemotaxis protein [Alkalibacillus flavidus]|uniref:CheY-like chemotaxis protein n=1 Tax=Alkalibacillus flavidus TaxID=546021 RepID=A0ABV2KX51_9BACI
MGKYQAVVVDDEESIAMLMGEFLKQEDFHVQQFLNCHDALQTMDSGHVDLCFIDYLLPSMKGDKFIATLREKGDDTPVILMTGMAKKQLELNSNSDHQGVLEKPFTLSDVIYFVNKYVKK